MLFALGRYLPYTLFKQNFDDTQYFRAKSASRFSYIVHSTRSRSVFATRALFEKGDEWSKFAFDAAIKIINDDESTLPGIELQAETPAEPAAPFDIVGAERNVCNLMKAGVVGIVGPHSTEMTNHVQSLCDTMEIPHITARWHPRQRRSSCLVNLYPHPSILAKAAADIVLAWEWKGFTIVYDDYNALRKIGELVKIADDKGYTVSVRQLKGRDGEEDNYRYVLQEVKHSGEKNIVVEVARERLFDVMLQAQQVGLVGSGYSYIVTSLDFQSIDLEPFKWAGTNITGIRIVDPDLPHFKEVMKIINGLKNQEGGEADEEDKEGGGEGDEAKEEEVEALLIYDAVNLIAQALHNLDLIEPKEIDCRSQDAWESGYSVINFIKMTHPYGMLKEDSRQLTGNDRFEGFGIDLIHELSMMSGFNYTFHVQEDKSSGSPKTLENGTRVWSGMIGEILAGRADLAIADMTITRERERDADFTMPFMNLGISVLYRKPMKAPPSLFSFLSPFSYEVWGYILSAYLGVSFLLFIMARISPYEWTNPYPCIQEPTELETQFSLSNSLWFTTGSILQQGSDVAPISVSTRMVAAIWWFFTLIMVSSYTANLAAFLTIEQKIEPFTDVQGLANQDKVKYGAKKGGATANFFRDSKEPIYQKMWEFMEANPDVMMSTNEAGVDRVQYNTDYAFLMESASIEYEMERKCELMRVGDLLDNKGYGIAMRQNSSYRNVLSRNVIKLQEKGKLTQLKDKWWKEKRGGGACRATEEGGAASDLGLDNVGGVFVVLLGGCVLAVIISFGELLWDIYQRDDKVSFKDELIEEIKFIARCHGTVKPVRKGDASPSGSGKSGSKSSGNSRSQSPKTESRSRSRINHSRSRFSGRLLTDRLSLD
ncbi:unnamed protein product [Nesidiocoris tenuis]|uniref:Ionotropic glutamate receptor C-terminal domain-containing protein n=1 Tax=Nesidiocoris tenuis TaxID=355587 RepID=A0A6H5GTZ0_9HEMI|nr:unnamed protein product [Nesidiocoris tenuis]